jgi:hypothetical protein
MLIRASVSGKTANERVRAEYLRAATAWKAVAENKGD